MRDRIIYIGGAQPPTTSGRSTPTRSTFTKLATVGTPPVAAASEIATYDAEHDRIVYAGIEHRQRSTSAGSDQGDWTFLDTTLAARAGASGVLDPTRSLLVALDNIGPARLLAAHQHVARHRA